MNSRFSIAYRFQDILVIISIIFIVFFSTQRAAAEENIHEWTVNTIDWKPDGSYALIGGTGGLIARYDGKSVVLQSNIQVEPKQIAWNPDGSEALIVGYGGIFLFKDDLSPLKLGPDLDYSYAGWDPSGKYALIGGHIVNEHGGYSASLLKYDGRDIEDIPFLLNDNSNASISHISWNPKGDFALIYKDDGKLYEYRDHEVTLIKEIDDIFDLAWKPDGSEVFFLYNDLSLASWDRRKPSDIDALTTGKGGSNWTSGMLSWKPDGSFVLVVGYSSDQNICRTYKYDGTMKFIEELADKHVNDIAWHPSDKYAVVVGSYNGTGGLLQKIAIADQYSEVVLSPSVVAISIITITIIAYLGLTETGRYTSIQFLFLPLFAKLRKKHPLENKMREIIYEYIELYPGENYTAIKKTLGLANGTLVYHLKILMKENLIKGVSEGRYKRFYPIESDKLDKTKIYEDKGTQMLTELQKKIIEKIGEEPEISQVEVAKSLGVSRQLVNYHITKLVKAGVLKLKGKTKSKSYA
jgi:WD40 repeat protein/DNA-binding Lrp family transcriptional regulator